MTGGDFPFPLLGLIHIRNRITQRREIHVDEPLTLRVHATGLEAHERGSRFDLITEATVDCEPVWRRDDRDGWVHCADGQRRWGRFGAAGLLLRAPAPDASALVLLQHRAAWTPEGRRWGLPGGARTSEDDAVTAALREAREEAGVEPEALRVVAQRADHPADDGWSYTTVIADAAAPRPLQANHESAELRWVPEPAVATLPLHPDFAASWKFAAGRSSLRTRPTTLLVDAANVVGSVPDGWWRDRAGAAQRLLRRCAATVPGTLPLADGELRWVQRCIVVLEGAASAAHDVDGVEVIRARGSGDDTLAEIADREPESLLISADRGLRSRLPPTATSAGPGVLLDRLPQPVTG
ncbi:MAG: NUDIX domain-containing protein [Pseudonocardiaceae bacterium]|nr:NUDIX domain-containing protein [Pseudonocardiaceae bacterium]